MLGWDVYPNVKIIYRATIDTAPDELVLYEDQRLTSITIEERFDYTFANNLGRILEDFVVASLSPKTVDNSLAKIPPN